MASIHIKRSVEVDVYQVNIDGNEVCFDLDADHDDDLIISISREEALTALGIEDTEHNVVAIRDAVSENDLYEALAEECCFAGTYEMVRAFLKNHPKAVEDACKDHFGEDAR